MIYNTRDLVEALMNMPDSADFAGNVINTNILVEDEEGVCYSIEDFYTRGNGCATMKLRRIK